MQLMLTLEVGQKKAVLPINYSYPLMAAIYKCIGNTNNQYAQFLHDKGYGVNHKYFKFFTFSELITPYKIQDDRMILQSNEGKLKICFHLNDALKPFINGVFKDQHFYLGDKKSSVNFIIKQIDIQNEEIKTNELVLLPNSCIVTGFKNERGHYDYLHPQDKAFTENLKTNLLSKYQALEENITEQELNELKKQIQIEVSFFANPPKSRLITIQAHTPQETKIKGYKNFKIHIKAPKNILAIALNSGLGLYNSMGFGCVEEFKK